MVMVWLLWPCDMLHVQRYCRLPDLDTQQDESVLTQAHTHTHTSTDLSGWVTSTSRWNAAVIIYRP